MSTNKFSIYQVFGDQALGLKGNTAAIVESKTELSEDLMQSLAADFNQPATTFIWKNNGQWVIHWFAPDGEIGLCGHGSLAAVAYLADTHGILNIKFQYSGGFIEGSFINNNNASISLDAILAEEESKPEQALIAGLGVKIQKHFKTKNKNIVLVDNETTVRKMDPDFQKLKECSDFGFIVTAPGDEVDFVSRTIIPHVGQLEDPATGSSHAVLTTYWSQVLEKNKLSALQLSARCGKFNCKIDKNVVTLSGEYLRIASGEIWPILRN